MGREGRGAAWWALVVIVALVVGAFAASWLLGAGRPQLATVVAVDAETDHRPYSRVLRLVEFG